MSQDFTGIPGTEKQTRTERSYGCPGPPGWSKFTGPYPLDLISTVLAAWHQKSVLQVCRDLEKFRSQSMAVSDVGQLDAQSKLPRLRLRCAYECDGVNIGHKHSYLTLL